MAAKIAAGFPTKRPIGTCTTRVLTRYSRTTKPAPAPARVPSPAPTLP